MTPSSGNDTCSAGQREQSATVLVNELDSAFFKTLSEPVRVDILKFLLLNGSSDIGTISKSMPQDRSVISRHLNIMLGAGLVSCVKQSRHTFYDVDSHFFLNKMQSITDKIKTCMLECGL